jgi:hypothetical protein
MTKKGETFRDDNQQETWIDIIVCFDCISKELFGTIARGATYVHQLLHWVGGASFPATLLNNWLFLCLMLWVYSIYTVDILKL